MKERLERSARILVAGALASCLLALGTTGVLASSVAVNDAASVRVMEALHDALRGGAGLPEGWLAARRAARGDALLEATAGSFTAWGV